MQIREPIPADEVRDVLDDILEGGEFRNEPSMLEEFIDWLEELLSDSGIDADTVIPASRPR